MDMPDPEQTNTTMNPSPEATPRSRVRLHRTECIVLRRLDLGEADRILTIFSRERGKLRVVAKGVRKTQSRLAGHLEPFARTSVLLAEGRNLDIVSQAQMVDPFRTLRDSEVTIACAGYIADLLDQLTVEEQPNVVLYEVVIEALNRLDKQLDPFITLRWFELTALRVLGFGIELRRCVGCGKELAPETNAFSPEGGGVVCAECAPGEPATLPLSVNGLKLMRLLERDLDRVDRLRFGEGLRREVESIMHVYIQHLIGRELRSLRVLRLLSEQAEHAAQE